MLKTIYYADIKENKIDGYYCREIHEVIPKTAIAISKELWQHLLDENKIIADIDSLTQIVFTLDEKQCYTIDHKDYFSIEEQSIKFKIEKTKEEKEIDTLKERINKLEKLIEGLNNIKN